MKSLPQWSATALLTAPVGAWALGIGDIELHSALNQPFQAEIELLSVTSEELEGLRVNLAARDTYQRLDLDRPDALSSLNFSIARNDGGLPVIRVTSREPVAEPFLTILLEVSYPSGRSLREYTVLLDPPIFTPSIGAEPPVRAAQANTPSAAAGAVERAPTPAVAETPAVRAPAPQAAARPAANPPPAAASGGDVYGPVQNAETLWSIASRLRPSDVTVNQMMLALYEANPAAFDGNMSRLLRGATLSVPEHGRLVARSPAEATAEVSRQETALASPRGEAVAAASAPSAAGAAAGAAAGGAQSRLRLVPPSTDSVIGENTAGGATASGGGAAGGGTGGGEAVARLETEVSTLRAELEESRRLIQLRDEQLLALQNQLAGAQAAPAAVAGEAAPGVELGDEALFADEAPVEDTTAEESVFEGEAPAVAAAAATAPAVDAGVDPVAAMSPAGAPAANEPSLVTRVLGWLATPMVLFAVGIGLVFAVALLYFRGRREEEAEDVTGRWDALEAEVARDEGSTTARLSKPKPEQSLIVEEQAGGPRMSSSAADAAEAAGSLDDSGTFSSQTVMNLDQGDPLAEADFHMAYGLYDQAAELVQKALEYEPKRRDLQLKLLEVFFVWGNKDAFRDTASRFKADAAGSDWDKVLIMGKQLCPDDTLFAEAGGHGADVDLDLAQTGSTELDFAFDEQGAGTAGTSESDAAIDLNFDTTDSADDLDFEIAATGEHIGSLDDDGDESGVHDLDLSDDDLLDIGAQTAAGLEAALTTDDDETGAASVLDEDTVETGYNAGDDDTLGFDGLVDDASSNDDLDIDALASTQESPTVESPSTGFDGDWASSLGLDETGSELTLDTDEELDAAVESLGADMESPTVESLGGDFDSPTIETLGTEAPTVETPTVETPWTGTEAIDADAPTMVTPSVDGGTQRLSMDEAEDANIAFFQPGGADAGEHTEEIRLDDLGLSAEELSGLDGLADLGDLDGDTREQPALNLDDDDDLLSATGVTRLGDDEDLETIGTAVLGESDVTMLAPRGDSPFTGTEVIERRDDEHEISGATALLETLESGDFDESFGSTGSDDGDGLDLDLDDLASALASGDGDTIEQPREPFGDDEVFDGGSTPLDLDIGIEMAGSDDPTGSADVDTLDPHTMTEIGTKLDLARAYIDMGDPDGARSILEEVVDEGDAGQKREAQGLIESLGA